MTNRLRVFRLIIAVLSSILVSSCGRGGSQTYLATPPTLTEPPGLPSVKPTPLAKEFVIQPCSQAQEFAERRLRYLASPPRRAGRPFCYIEGGGEGKLPDKGSGLSWSAGVFYLPKQMSPSDIDYSTGINAGGIDLAVRFNRPKSQFDFRSQPRARTGGRVPLDVNGHRGVLARVNSQSVWAVWFEDLPEGRSLFWHLLGGYSPDEITQFARAARDGIPPRERAAGD